MATFTPSSATSGFFQTLPTIPPQYSAPVSSPSTRNGPNDAISDDVILPRILSLYLPQPTPPHITTHLHSFARKVLHPSTLTSLVDAETNPPTLHLLTTFGTPNTISPLSTSHGWRALKSIQTAAGVVGHGYSQPTHPSSSATYNRRIHQFATLHLWSPSCAVSTCPMAMTDGAAVLLSLHISSPSLDPTRRHVFTESYKRLTSLDPSYAWTSGQWMTERSGGSDVRGTETVARLFTSSELESERLAGRNLDAHGLPLGPWSISGAKWFSSATDADMTVLLAQTQNGLSAFYAPLRRRRAPPPSPNTDVPEMNGLQPTRLKSKLGTHAVPTAELQLTNMRAHLIGVEGQGIKEIAAILNITRLHTASSVSCWGRGLAIARAFTKVRNVKGGMGLAENAQHVRWLSMESVKYRAASQLYFFGVGLLGASERPGCQEGTHAEKLGVIPNDQRVVGGLLRMLTPMMKARCSVATVDGLRECMEALGGVGYCENNEDGGVLNIARLFRDANVNPIWEGTVSVMAEDVLRVLNPKPTSHTPDPYATLFSPWLSTLLSAPPIATLFPHEIAAIRSLSLSLHSKLTTTPYEQLLWAGRDVLSDLETIICAVLLMADAAVNREGIAVAVARRWVGLRIESFRWRGGQWKEEVRMDRRIFLGDKYCEGIYGKGEAKL